MRSGHISVGCGCSGIVQKARAVGALAAHDVPAACRQHLKDYGWLLGCWELEQSDAAGACSLGRRPSAASLIQTDTDTQGVGQLAAGFADDFKADLASMWG